MTLWQALLHFANFVAPALGLAVFLALCEARPKAWGGLGGRRALLGLLCYSAVGVGVWVAGLWLLQADGRMLTYGALALTLGGLAAWRQGG